MNVCIFGKNGKIGSIFYSYFFDFLDKNNIFTPTYKIDYDENAPTINWKGGTEHSITIEDKKGKRFNLVSNDKGIMQKITKPYDEKSLGGKLDAAKYEQGIVKRIR